MNLEFTKDYILKNKGCYEESQVLQLSFINQSVITIEDILNSEIPFKDKIWFIWNKGEFLYDERKECYNQSKELQEVFTRNFTSHGGRVFYSSSYDGYSFGGQVGFEDQKRIIKELLKYSKL